MTLVMEGHRTVRRGCYSSWEKVSTLLFRIEGGLFTFEEEWRAILLVSLSVTQASGLFSGAG